jgi:hypothetical protein
MTIKKRSNRESLCLGTVTFDSRPFQPKAFPISRILLHFSGIFYNRSYFLSGLPRTGPVPAHQLLNCFKTIENIIVASLKELTKVNGIGPKTASASRTLPDTPYSF